MCLILFAYQAHPQYPLILAANRDEFYQRPAQAANWWPEHPELLAGKDLEAGGTWLGITKQGRLAGITNVRDPYQRSTPGKSRGLLPLEFLTKGLPAEQFADRLQQSAAIYQGYNLVYGHYEQLNYFSNRIAKPQPLAPGVYGLSNAQMNTPWPKVVKGKNKLEQLLQRRDISADALLQLLSDTEIVSDDQLPSTGVSLEWERQLSAIQISGSEYGTRVSTVLTINKHRQVCFYELPRDPQKTVLAEYHFNLA